MIDNEFDFLKIMFTGYKNYFVDICKYKYYVWKFSRQFDLKLSWVQILSHGLFRLRPSIFDAFVVYFYCEDELLKGFDFGKDVFKAQYKENFNIAWNHYQKRNKYFWEYWILVDGNDLLCLEMPGKYVREMIAGWYSSYYMRTGKLDVKTWYIENITNMKLHYNTRKFVESLINV